MKVIVGKNAGFCYGVKRAVDAANEIVNNSDEKVYCLGEIVHNKQVVKDLENKGITFVDDIKDVKDSTIIRAHGISKEIYEYAKNNNIKLEDYTCPNVLSIHKIANKYKELGYYIFLLGSKTHPENIGTVSYCGYNSFIIESIDDVAKAINKFKESKINKLLVISQTTFSLEKFSLIENKIKEELGRDTELVIKNTICKTTEIRQKEAENLSKQVDYMIIVGGKNSSNTRKLYEITSKNCESICIETADELNIDEIKKYNKIGIMAGASTPDKSIDDVVNLLKGDNMKKRVSARAIIIEDNSVYVMFRRRVKDDGSVKEYYVIPGGGIEESETLEENVIRELKEEFSVDVKVIGYLGYDEREDTIAHFFRCEILDNQTPKLGGEELEKCCEENYYEIRKVNLKDLDNIDILSTNMILKAYNEEYIDY